jgi:biopolymer transport protein ExbD
MPNIIPMATMADVAFLLIIFFMLTSTFAKDTGLDITLPRAITSQALPKRDVTIWVNRLGQLRVNQNWIRPDDLPEVLRREFAQGGARGVTIRGDEGVPYGTIVTVMDTAKLLGADITLAAEIEVEGSRSGAD